MVSCYKGRGGAVSLGKVLPHGSSGGDIVWNRDMGSSGANGAEATGSASAFPASGHRKKGNSAEVRVIATCDGKTVLYGAGK